METPAAAPTAATDARPASAAPADFHLATTRTDDGGFAEGDLLSLDTLVELAVR